LFSPGNTIDVPPLFDVVAPPGVAVAMYCVITAPPLLAGAVQLNVTEPSPGAPVRPAGAPGTVRGVTAADAEDAGPLPAALVATTLNV
jgi:hypothetical protein